MSLTELMLGEITLTLFINAIECVYKSEIRGGGSSPSSFITLLPKYVIDHLSVAAAE